MLTQSEVSSWDTSRSKRPFCPFQRPKLDRHTRSNTQQRGQRALLINTHSSYCVLHDTYLVEPFRTVGFEELLSAIKGRAVCPLGRRLHSHFDNIKWLYSAFHHDSSNWGTSLDRPKLERYHRYCPQSSLFASVSIEVQVEQEVGRAAPTLLEEVLR